MTVPSHQTVSLSAGRHPSPDTGACVMELASMLAGEPFSDHPRSVCPVIGAFLRRYNDGVDDRRRRDLIEIAALVVGTRAGRATQGHRRDWCRGRLAELRPAPRPPWGRPLRSGASLADACAQAFLDRRDHDGALRLVRELVALGRPGGTGDNGPTAEAERVLALPG